MGVAVVDADGHVIEPMSAWDSVPEHVRPVISRDSHGYEHVVVGGKEILAVSLGLLGTPGSIMSDPSRFKPLGDCQPGGSDPVVRIADMDAEGIDIAVLYPSIGLYFWALEDPVAATALATAYNEWLAGYCSAAPDRLYGAAMLPMQDPRAAVDELRRVDQAGTFRAAFVRPNPCNGRVLSDPAYEPVWEAAEAIGMTIAIHEGSSVTIPTLGSDRPFNALVLHTVSHPFEQMMACAQLIADGVLERHPTLRFVFLESGATWAAFWLERMDEQVHGFGGFCPDMVLTPSEYFARQCWVSAEVDESALPAVAPVIGEDRIVWGSDYPHHDATFPGAVTKLRKTLGPLPAATQERILGGNAQDLYRLPQPSPG
jgi:uncharacterized protein